LDPEKILRTTTEGLTQKFDEMLLAVCEKYNISQYDIPKRLKRITDDQGNYLIILDDQKVVIKQETIYNHENNSAVLKVTPYF